MNKRDGEIRLNFVTARLSQKKRNFINSFILSMKKKFSDDLEFRKEKLWKTPEYQIRIKKKKSAQ